MMEKAQEHFRAGEFDEAEAIYRRVLEEDPGNAEAMFMLSRVREQLGDADEALSLLENAGRLDPFNPNLQHALGALHIRRREPDEARQSFSRAIEINPGFVDAHNGMAFAELARGRFKAAAQSANLALTEEPENVQALIYMGIAKLEQDHHREAIAYLQEALRLDPANDNAQAQLGRAFLAAGNAGFAMQCFENALQSRPDSPELLDFLACAQLHNGQFELAAGNFRKALTLGRSNSAIFGGLAKCEMALGNQDQAEVLMRRGIRAEPENVEMVTTFAEYQMARGNTEEALGMLNKLPLGEHEQVHVLLSKAYRQLDDTTAALDALGAWVASGRASAEVALEHAGLLRDNGRKEEADQLIDKLLSAENPPLAVRMFRALQRVGEGDEEGARMLSELEKLPGLTALQRLGLKRSLADALHRLGKYYEAAETYMGLAGSRPSILEALESAPVLNRSFMESDKAQEILARWPSAPPKDGRPRPVFIFSWPGSGRERLVAALAAHPGIMMVADPPDAQAERRKLISKPAGARELTVMPDASLQLARGRYWKDLRGKGLEPGERLTVDAMWLPAEQLPTISRLFPEAGVIIVKRQAGDMLLAWLQGGLAGLETLAERYRQQLDLLNHCRARLSNEFIEVDYDRVCEQPAAELENLTSALGLAWDQAVEERFNATPQAVSAAKGDWVHYSEVLKAGLALLED